jgi:hypothetical protein
MVDLPADAEFSHRRLRLAHKALEEILDIGDRADLPSAWMHWMITEWSVVGQCQQVGDDAAEARRAAFEEWAAALGLGQRSERTGRDGVIELRAAAKDWRGHHLLGVAVWADLYPTI